MAALILSAMPSFADSPAALAPNPGPGSVEAQSVSSATHAAEATRAHSATTPAIPSTITRRPLTRAAAQLRIDEMSPVGWLSQFGNVSIGQRD